MPYKYLPHNFTAPASQKETMLKEFQAHVDAQFYNTTDWFTIQRELSDNEFENIDVRLNTVYSPTGTKLSDDYRKVIFQNPANSYGLGTKYFFDSSYWLTINYEIFGKPTASVIIHKCRNVLKWINPVNGAIYIEPCVFKSYEESSSSPLYNDNITLANGQSVIIVQNNEKTAGILYNQRFYLNHYCYKITAITSSLNNPTSGSAPLLYFTITRDPNNPDIDDIDNNLANVRGYDYQVIINQNDFQQSVGYATQLDASVLLNGSLVENTVLWESSNPNIVGITPLGVLTTMANGVATITAKLGGNPSIYDTIQVTVTAAPVVDYHIVVLPDSRYILKNLAQTYTVFAFSNNTQLPNAFIVSTSGVPTECYDITVIDGNTFVVRNKERYPARTLDIVFTDIVTRETKEINVDLRGVF